jgi:hypothetical protein
MSRDHIPKALRERVATRAGFRCGYCRTSSFLVGTLFEIDHIVPESFGGKTEEDNLWLACPTCNGHKSDRTWALDSVSGETVRLFDPRNQTWTEHFAWSEAGDEIIGLTPTGRATAEALHLNRPVLVYARCLWVRWGCHPPPD